MFLHTFPKVSVAGSWQLFNMRNRFYIPLIRFLIILIFYEVLFARLYLSSIISQIFFFQIWVSDFIYNWFMYQVFLAGNPIPVTGSYWWMLNYFPNGLTQSFLFISSWFMEHLYMLWIEWFSFVFFLLFFWWVYNSTVFSICQHFFEIFSIFLLYYMYISDLICYLFCILYYFQTFKQIHTITIFLLYSYSTCAESFSPTPARSQK